MSKTNAQKTQNKDSFNTLLKALVESGSYNFSVDNDSGVITIFVGDYSLDLREDGTYEIG